MPRLEGTIPPHPTSTGTKDVAIEDTVDDQEENGVVVIEDTVEDQNNQRVACRETIAAEESIARLQEATWLGAHGLEWVTSPGRRNSPPQLNGKWEVFPLS